MRYNFDWNPDKARKNKRKHKITFERATTIFRDPNAISIVDEKHSKHEDRWITMGILISTNLQPGSPNEPLPGAY